jgi:hypothetical protein
MKEQSIVGAAESRPVWESLEASPAKGAAAVATTVGGGRAGLGARPLRTQRRRGRKAGISERVRQAPPAERDGRHAYDSPASRPRTRGANRESVAAAVQAAHRVSRPALARVVLQPNSSIAAPAFSRQHSMPSSPNILVGVARCSRVWWPRDGPERQLRARRSPPARARRERADGPLPRAA